MDALGHGDAHTRSQRQRDRAGLHGPGQTRHRARGAHRQGPRRVGGAQRADGAAPAVGLRRLPADGRSVQAHRQPDRGRRSGLPRRAAPVVPRGRRPAQPLRDAAGRHVEARRDDRQASRQAARLPLGRDALRADPVPGGRSLHAVPQQHRVGVLRVLRRGPAHDLRLHRQVRSRGVPLVGLRAREPVLGAPGLRCRGGSRARAGLRRRGGVHGLRRRREGARGRSAPGGRQGGARGRRGRPVRRREDPLRLRDARRRRRAGSGVRRDQRVRQVRPRRGCRPL